MKIEEFLSHLTDPEWTKKQLLPKLNQSHFQTLHEREEYCENGASSSSGRHDYSGWSRNGFYLGQIGLNEPPSQEFKKPCNDRERNLTISPVNVYLFNDGEIGIVQSCIKSWDSGKSICAYGEWGSNSHTKIMIFNQENIEPYLNTLAKMINEKLELKKV